MRVVKCESHIPEWAWGRVVADNDFPDIMIRKGKIGTPVTEINKCDTFPLPEVGDKVYASDYGTGFNNIRDWEYRGMIDNKFICRHSGCHYVVWKYIEPVKEEKKEKTFAVDIKLKANIDYDIYVNGEKIGKRQTNKR